MKEALSFYSEVLGCKEAWRAGEHTVGLDIPDSDIQIVLDHKDANFPAGGQFVMESVDSFYEKNKERIKFVWEPFEIPPGRLAAFEDPSGNVIRIMDFSKVRS